MILTAVQDGSRVKVFAEGMTPLYIVEGILQGFTSSSITIKSGNIIKILDEKGQQIGIL